jgi:hypothetical protein
LSETPKDPTSLVSIQRAVGRELVVENPLARDHVSSQGDTTPNPKCGWPARPCTPWQGANGDPQERREQRRGQAREPEQRRP